MVQTLQGKPIPVRLSDELIEWLDINARFRGVTRSEFMRACIELVKGPPVDRAMADPSVLWWDPR